jgi:PAS domain S-box-containing protein
MSASIQNTRNSGEKMDADYEHKILDVASIGILITRIEEGTVLYANEMVARLLGLPDTAAMIGMPIPDFYWEPAERQTVLKLFRDEGSVANYDIRARRKDNSMIWVAISIQPFTFEGEQALLSEIVDISARKQTEDELKRNVNFTNTLLDALPTPVFYKDKEGRYQGCNRAFTDVMGKTAGEIRGKTVYELWPGENAEAYHGRDLELIHHPQHQVYEAATRDKDGNIRPVIFAKDVFFDEGGNVAGLVGAFVDITQQKKAEQLLQQSEANLSSALHVAAMGYWEFDIPTQTFTFNDQYYSLHGITAQEAGGYQMSVQRFAQEFVHAEDAALVGGATQQALETTDPNFQIQIEARIMRKDGQPRWVTVWFRIEKDEQGRTIKLHGVNQDITGRKELEAQIREGFERRGYQVQISNEISQEVAAASELEELFKRVVTLTKERLGYYHTQLLRFDPAQEAVVLINGYGETGRKMLEGGHKMPMGSGLIGTAAASGETVMRSILANDPDWKPNPLLPETRGEIAVPIKWQGKVLGVLDVQSDQPSALTEDDRLLLEGLCGQIAIAMQSAELVEITRQNEARLAEALRIARLANWEYDVEKDIFTFNDQFYSIFHTTAGKAGGYQLTSAQYAELFVHPDDRGVVGAEIGKALSSTESVYNTTLDHRVLYAEGGVGYITVKVTVERDEAGKITRFYGANQDITERKQAEEALASERRLLGVLMSTIPDQVYVKDAEHRFLLANDVVVHSLGAETSDVVLGKTDFDFHPHELAEQYYADEKSLMESGASLIDHEETILDRKTGNYRHVSTTKIPLRDSQGSVVGVVGINHDITERKQAENALRRSEQEMAERLEEISRLYRAMSHEGWKTYRERADLPAGFIFDHGDMKPVEEKTLAEEHFARIPMRVTGGEVVGNLAVANDPQHPMSEDDIQFLQQVSDQIALALEGARLSAQTQSALAQTEKLSEAGLRFTRAVNLQELVQIAVETLGIAQINRAVLEIFNYNSANEIDSMNVVANWWNGTGHEPTVVSTNYTPEALPILSLFITPEPIFIADAFHDQRIDEVSMQVVSMLNIHAVAVLPLFQADHQIGVFLLESEEVHEFHPDEIRVFSAMGPLISTVLENRRQFERAQRQAEREGLLNVISQKIQSATSVEAVLQIAARELGHALGAPMTIAQLSMKDKK